MEFLESKTVAVVSSHWIIGPTKCCWPVKWKDGSMKIFHAVKSHIDPGNDWQVFTVRIMTSGGVYSVSQYELLSIIYICMHII